MESDLLATPAMKAAGSQALLKVVSYKARSWCISQERRVEQVSLELCFFNGCF